MSSKGRGGRYAVGIGSGAAAGASLGTSILPGWGTLIGGVVGAGAGAIGAGIHEGDLADEDKKIREQQALRRKQIALDMLRQRAQALGADTSFTDAKLAQKGLLSQEALELEQLEKSRELPPDAFVGMAYNLGNTATGLYRGFKTNVPSIDDGNYGVTPGYDQAVNTATQPGAYTMQQPGLVSGPNVDPYDGGYNSLDPSRFRLRGGFR